MIVVLLCVLASVGVPGADWIPPAAEQVGDVEISHAAGSAAGEPNPQVARAGSPEPRKTTKSVRIKKVGPGQDIWTPWQRWDNRHRRGLFKIALGLLGAAMFVLVLSPTRKRLLGFSTTEVLLLATGLLYHLVASAVFMLVRGSAGWAVPTAIALYVAGFAWVGLGIALGRRTWCPALVGRGALLALLLAGLFAWTGFGAARGEKFVHMHEFFHYYVGSKYFPENRYLHLYECAVVAENEDGFPLPRRRVRNLALNRGEFSDDILARETGCHQAFAPVRWEAFKQDVRFFRAEMSRRQWDAIFRDKGYNATPLWTSIGSPLSNWAWVDRVPTAEEIFSPSAMRDESGTGRLRRAEHSQETHRAFQTQTTILALIDPLLYAGAFALVFWAFGLEACALMALLLGVGLPWDFRFTGGAFARVPWFFTLTAAVCLVKKGHRVWGGASLMTSAMLRVFPAAFFGGVAMTAAVRLIRRRRITRAHLGLALGAAIALAVLVPVGMTTGGPSIYPQFLENTKRHASTPLGNHAGLRALFSAHPDRGIGKTIDLRQADVRAPWRAARIATFKEREPYYWVCAALLFALVWAAARKMEDWERLVASTLLVIALVDLTSYYFLFMVLWAPLVSRKVGYALLAIVMAMATQIPLLVSKGDVISLSHSAIAIAFHCIVLGLVIADPRRRSDGDLRTEA